MQPLGGIGRRRTGMTICIPHWPTVGAYPARSNVCKVCKLSVWQCLARPSTSTEEHETEKLRKQSGTRVFGWTAKEFQRAEGYRKAPPLSSWATDRRLVQQSRVMGDSLGNYPCTLRRPPESREGIPLRFQQGIVPQERKWRQGDKIRRAYVEVVAAARQLVAGCDTQDGGSRAVQPASPGLDATLPRTPAPIHQGSAPLDAGRPLGSPTSMQRRSKAIANSGAAVKGIAQAFGIEIT